MKQKEGLVVWITGLAGSGKSTIGSALALLLRKHYANVVYLDGDELREILGVYSYDKKGRIDVAKKRSNIARFLSHQGIITIVTTISLFNEIYLYNRAHLANYFEVYIYCAWEELIRRDQKSLYSQAQNNLIHNVVGVDIPYDEPCANMQIDNTQQQHIEQKAMQIYQQVLHRI